jgi:diaminopimelate decarboxylase
VLKPGEEKHFAVVDAAMNDLMRPALYDAWHDIVPVRKSAATGDAAMRCLRNRRPGLRVGRFPRPRPRCWR